MRKVGIYFRGRTIRHAKRWGKDLWIAIRVKDSHEVIRLLRDKGFFGRDIEGYLILPEDVLREMLGEDLYKELLDLEEEEGTARRTRHLERDASQGASGGASPRGVSL